MDYQALKQEIEKELTTIGDPQQLRIFRINILAKKGKSAHYFSA